MFSTHTSIKSELIDCVPIPFVLTFELAILSCNESVTSSHDSHEEVGRIPVCMEYGYVEALS